MKPATSLLPQDLFKSLVKGLFPEGTSLQVKRLEITSEEVTLVVSSTRLEGRCPLCGEPTRRVHSRYERTLQDLPFSGKRVQLSLHVRRFFCANPSCRRQIFSERLPA